MDEIQRKKLKQHLAKLKAEQEQYEELPEDFNLDSKLNEKQQNLLNATKEKMAKKEELSKKENLELEESESDPRFKDFSKLNEVEKSQFFPKNYSELDEADKNKYHPKEYLEIQKFKKLKNLLK